MEPVLIGSWSEKLLEVNRHWVTVQGSTGIDTTCVMHTFLLQDKKYYPTAEEVYGPEVEVGVYTLILFSVL